MTIYRIADWNKLYENNRSRLVRDLTWVPVPNSHDGESYARIMTRKDAAEVFAVWILLLQVASRCNPRGVLVRSNGQPLDPEAFSLKTRAPSAWFQKAIPVLMNVGWIECNELADIDTALDCHPTDAVLTPDCPRGDEEWKGMEGNGKKGTPAVGTAPTSDSEWLASLSQNPAYAGIDVTREHGKMATWCAAHRKQPTRRRFVNWLNRVDRPMVATSPKSEYGKQWDGES